MAGEEPGSEVSEREKRGREEYLAQVAEEERLLGERAQDLGGGGIIDYLFFLFFLFISNVKHRKAKEG